MIVKNVADLNSLDDLEVASGVRFGENCWRIPYGTSEHVTFRFDDILDGKNSKIADFPALEMFLKILTYYSFPEAATNDYRSWNSTFYGFSYIRHFAKEFLFERFLVTKGLIRNIDGEQIKDFLDHCARASEHSPKFTGLTITLPRILKIWVFASETGSMPDWCRATFTVSAVMSKDFKDARHRLYEGDESNTWNPLNAQQIKTCYDTAFDYIYRFSEAICEASYLVKTRPKHPDGTPRPVREDGRTKDLFKRLKALKVPTFPGTENRIFEFKPKTQRVKSLGYKCGYQDRTTIDISAVRPEVINLKRACIFIIGLLTGLRRSEIAYLKVNTLFLRDGSDYLKITRFKTASDPKYGTPDEIPVPAIVADAIRVLERLFKAQRKELGSDFLLVTDIGNRKAYKKIKINTVTKDIRHFVVDCSGETGHAHQLRKTIAWLLISKGEENIDLIRQLFGHKTYGMTLRYILRNELLSGSVLELLEENYTEDLQEALSKIASGEAVGDLADTIRQRSSHHYSGQILVSEVESFVHSALESGVPFFISRIPIGGFCISSSDLSKKKPPCIANTDDNKPSPEFCDYLNCPHVLHTSESIDNVERQIEFYEKKLRHVPEAVDDRVEHFYTSRIESNKALLATLKTRKDSSFISEQEAEGAAD